MNRLACVVSMVVVLLVTAGMWSETMAAEPEGILTLFRVLAARPKPAPEDTETVLVVPGTVVMPGVSPEQDASNVLDLMTKLKDTYRLGDVTITNSVIAVMKPGAATDVPSLAGDLNVRVTLLGFNQSVATYTVSILQGDKVLAEPRISVPRGERAITASLDGEAAPYVFIVIEPMKPSRDGEANPPAVMPRLVRRVQPVYPPEAKKAGIDGIVMLQGTVGTDGVLHDLKPLRSEPIGLADAAVKAVSQWRYEPARDADGKAVETTLTITVSFILDHSRPAADKPAKK